jgi:hypothetical protein
MLRLIGLLGPAPIVARTLAPVLVASSLVAQQPYRTPIHRPAPPKPALQCFAIWPDTGSRPRFLPESLILGANWVGRSSTGFRAAAVAPDRIPWTSGDREDTLGATWSAYGPLYAADSIYVAWWVISGGGPPIGELRAEVNGDSLSGRAVEGLGPGLPIHGRSTSCPPGR